jgi:hypothetical protein
VSVSHVNTHSCLVIPIVICPSTSYPTNAHLSCVQRAHGRIRDSAHCCTSVPDTSHGSRTLCSLTQCQKGTAKCSWLPLMPPTAATRAGMVTRNSPITHARRGLPARRAGKREFLASLSAAMLAAILREGHTDAAPAPPAITSKVCRMKP